MKAEEILERADFKSCATVHGHVCPGLAIGYMAARAALDRLASDRAQDEEIIAIVETDACSADAVQVLTGCTFGKGNFLFKDYGKMVLTLLSQATGQGIRVALQDGASKPDQEHMALLHKIMKDDASPEEHQRFSNLHHQKTCQILNTPQEQLFSITKIEQKIPPKAIIQTSVPCSHCGEPTMPAKMIRQNGHSMCRSCINNS